MLTSRFSFSVGSESCSERYLHSSVELSAAFAIERVLRNVPTSVHYLESSLQQLELVSLMVCHGLASHDPFLAKWCQSQFLGVI